MERLTIGPLARQAGVGVETVRFYERRGLLRQPSPPSTGYRIYPAETIGRIRFIRHAQALGFTLEEIAALLALRVTPGSSCAAVRGRAAVKLADVETRIAKLEQIRGALEKLVASCPGRGALRNCTILEALGSVDPGLPTKASPTAHRGTKRATSMKSIEVKIEGMHCEGCAATIQALLSHEPGVKSASVSFSKGEASVLYDPKETDAARVAAAIRKAGYRASGGQDMAAS